MSIGEGITLTAPRLHQELIEALLTVPGVPPCAQGDELRQPRRGQPGAEQILDRQPALVRQTAERSDDPLCTRRPRLYRVASRRHWPVRFFTPPAGVPVPPDFSTGR